MKVLANRDVRSVGGRAGFGRHLVFVANLLRAKARTPVWMMALGALSFEGCKKSDSPVPPPVTTASQPASQPAATPAVLTIGGEPSEFAVTHCDVSVEQGSLHVLLYGSDAVTPPVSSFYFDMTVDGDSPAALSGAAWHMAPAPDEDVNSSVGIFLNGDAIRLQPKEVTIEFSGVYPTVTATITGTFLRDGDEQKIVKASGSFAVNAREKSAR